MNKKKIIIIMGSIVLLVLLGFVAYRLAYNNIHVEEEAAEEEPEEVVAEEPEEEPEPEKPVLQEARRIIDFEALWEQNEDVYAWIEVPGTIVDYPILQHPTDDAYYLDHTIDHAAGLPGSIYTESVNAKDFSDAITVIYGHNMKNDTFFGSLHDYENAEFFKENPYVYIYTPTHQYTYEIFGAIIFDDRYIPYVYDVNSGEDAMELAGDLMRFSGNKNKEIIVTAEDKIIMLSTCIGNLKQNRYEVAAVLREVIQYAQASK